MAAGRLALLGGCFAAIVFGQHQHATAPTGPAILFSGMGTHQHPIATANPQAQRFFTQGLILLYGFNREEALRSFRQAAELDPKSPMPHWGAAMALGPHVNGDGDGDVDRKASCEEARKAAALAAGAPAHERAYVSALLKRCPATDPPAELDNRYVAAMRGLARQYPDDADAQTLFAESLMIPNAWRWWTPEGLPSGGTAEAVRVLEEVTRRNPDHPGANHLFLHAIEMSPSPERAIPAAQRLMGIVPNAGHLIHMAGHIWLLTGDWEAAASANERAAAVDEAYIKQVGVRHGPYQLGYYPHNLHFIVYARSAQGRFADADQAARKLAAQAAPGYDAMPEMIEYFLGNRYFVLYRFARWNEILALPAPNPKWRTSNGFWRWARASALAALGRTAEARAEQKRFEEIRAAEPEKTPWLYNTVKAIYGVAAQVLEARLASSPADSIANLRKAVELQDALSYDEPPAWFYPVRESLGGALLRSGKPAEAEAVFREDLKKNRRNGRSLFGLLESLKAQGKTFEAGWVQREFDAAWRRAEIKLTVAGL
ncbi:MAG: hypothetical protein FJW39_26865 [Acidobacteria bacterium]|nr:hypothetical protein [Acidobacteriota bacterium]